jgi:hypothetical protein
MRRLAPIFLAFAVLAPAAAPSPAAALTYAHCRGIVDAGPTGMDPADVKGLRKRHVSCPRARRVARQWLKPFGNRTGDDGSVRFGRWICFDGIGQTSEGRKTRVFCKARGGQRVRFYLG